ncbi:MAG TPA: peroxidase family protein [Candidatus Dormibacteraeota bacterium]|nr:peroxidase family protein [Candidatus Dormibacteraeota bacterium]
MRGGAGRRLIRWSVLGLGAVVATTALSRWANKRPRPSLPEGPGGSLGSVPAPRFSLLERAYAALAERVDHSLGWHKLPGYLGALILAGVRTTLRRKNLQDTWNLPIVGVTPPSPVDDRYLTARTSDGTFNNLEMPLMGSANTRFGRNVPLDKTVVESDRSLLSPNPRTVSRELLTRDSFIPASTLNLHAAAWLQFMVHDWLSHGQNDKDRVFEVPLDKGDPWPNKTMRILRTRQDPTRPSDDTGPPSFINVASEWWDASQLYGNDLPTQMKVRSMVDGKLTVDKNRLLPIDDSGIEITGVSGNWWIGLELMHTLFTLEHNAICDRLTAEYPTWSDQELFDRARLINAALLAKIHTVEWTTAILGHPALQIALRANWWGLATERVSRLVGRLSKSELISGIPGSDPDQFGVPYSITEEFVAVYRMHPLLPDDFIFRAVADNAVIDSRGFSDLAFANARKTLEKVTPENALYTFGTVNPGAITLHNFPKGMQQLTEPDGTLNDIAATDILRIRERGVPRYNEFRKLLHKAPVRTFEELCANPTWAEQIRRVYEGDIDKVDLMIGLYAETPPPGFGFSDTAFRIFILMASRRLNSDRFFTTDFTPEVYTPAGMAWIADNGFASVLLRHFPNLRPALRGVKNPFAPWTAVAGVAPQQTRPEFEPVAKPKAQPVQVSSRQPKGG